MKQGASVQNHSALALHDLSASCQVSDTAC